VSEYQKVKASRQHIHEKLKATISEEMADKHEKGEAVWQLPVEKKEEFFLPFNPVLKNNKDREGKTIPLGRYYYDGNAMYLMQKQYEYAGADGKMDNRWIKEDDLKKYHLLKKENADIVAIPVGEEKDDLDTRAYSRVVNFSQLVPEEGHRFPKSFYRDEYRNHGKEMLMHNSFSIKAYSQDKDGSLHREAGEEFIPAEDVKNDFFSISRKAFISANKKYVEKKKYAEKKKAEYLAGAAQFDDELKQREEHLLELDVSGPRPKGKEKAFEYDLATNAQQCFEKNEGKLNSSYIFKTVKDSLLAGLKEKVVGQLLSKFAPESVKDGFKIDNGRESYSAFVLGQVCKDKAFLQEYADKRLPKERAI